MSGAICCTRCGGPHHVSQCTHRDGFAIAAKEKHITSQRSDTRVLLDFLVELSSAPNTFYMSGPDPIVRGPGKEWLLSYNCVPFEGCLYGSTSIEVIRKAKRRIDAQRKAVEMITEASK